MNHDELLALLRQQIKEAGGIHRYAERHNICVGYLTNVLYCAEKPGPKIALSLGLKKVVSYEPIK